MQAHPSPKNVLVTGATSGIGQAIAVRFAREGANVALNYRKDLSSLDETRSQIEESIDPSAGLKIVPVQADVSKEDQVIGMFEEAIAHLGRLDVLINNAGIQIEEESHEVEIDDFDKVINVNLRGAYLCAREAIQQFLKQESEGLIINVSSVHEII
ncbi:MAG: SDR family NAD(P)-dependent oxidoreductase, partial [Cyanobacteriota bacterium]|nr:SDR family NAD(P)-dependent oxidoreductase [Cyanobacteriota bacterium]